MQLSAFSRGTTPRVACTYCNKAFQLPTFGVAGTGAFDNAHGWETNQREILVDAPEYDTIKYGTQLNRMHS